ncbi:MAG: cell division protein FtsA [Candidatus Brennerbacteria bacterium]|nr:cell division protein FtsA [Candidatus Brennerbacteria bacterium]
MSYVVTGIDIGSSAVRGAVAEIGQDGKLAVRHTFARPSAGFRRGVLVDAEEATHVLRDAALILKNISRRAMQNVFVNVASEHVRARPSRGIVAVARADQEIQEEDIGRVIEASRAVKLPPNATVLHHIVREYFVDDVGDIANPLGMNGSRLEVSALVVEAFGPHVNVLVKALERVGLKVGGLIVNPLAAAQSTLSKRQKELGCLLVDFGFGTTSLVMYEEGKVAHVKVIPVGAGHVTNDIAVGLRTSVDVAERLKLEFGAASARDVNRKETVPLKEFDPSADAEVTRRFLAEIIEVRIEEIVGLIKAEIKAVGRDLEFPGGAVLVGGGARLAGLPALVKEELKIPVQVGVPYLNEFSIERTEHRDLLEDPRAATLTGLMLWGATEQPTSPLSGNPVKKLLKYFIP